MTNFIIIKIFFLGFYRNERLIKLFLLYSFQFTFMNKNIKYQKLQYTKVIKIEI